MKKDKLQYLHDWSQRLLTLDNEEFWALNDAIVQEIFRRRELPEDWKDRYEGKSALQEANFLQDGSL